MADIAAAMVLVEEGGGAESLSWWLGFWEMVFLGHKNSRYYYTGRAESGISGPVIAASHMTDLFLSSDVSMYRLNFILPLEHPCHYPPVVPSVHLNRSI